METHQLYNYSPMLITKQTHTAPTDIILFNNVPWLEAYAQSSESVRSVLDSFNLTHTRYNKLVTVECSLGGWETLNIHPFGNGRMEIGHYWCEKAPSIPSERITVNLTKVDSIEDFNNVLEIKDIDTLHDNCMVVLGRFHLIKPVGGSLVIKVIETDTIETSINTYKPIRQRRK